jgi:hypothetical protein
LGIEPFAVVLLDAIDNVCHADDAAGWPPLRRVDTEASFQFDAADFVLALRSVNQYRAAILGQFASSEPQPNDLTNSIVYLGIKPEPVESSRLRGSSTEP